MIRNRFNKQCSSWCGNFENSIKDDNGNPVNLIAVERFQDAAFVRNEYGYIRSDISQLMNSQNQLQFQKLAERLQREITVRGLDTSKMSDDEIIGLVRPRWMQSPSQRIAFEEYLLSQRISALEDWQAKKQAEQAAVDAQDAADADNLLSAASKP